MLKQNLLNKIKRRVYLKNSGKLVSGYHEKVFFFLELLHKTLHSICLQIDFWVIFKSSFSWCLSQVHKSMDCHEKKKQNNLDTFSAFLVKNLYSRIMRYFCCSVFVWGCAFLKQQSSVCSFSSPQVYDDSITNSSRIVNGKPWSQRCFCTVTDRRDLRATCSSPRVFPLAAQTQSTEFKRRIIDFRNTLNSSVIICLLAEVRASLVLWSLETDNILPGIFLHRALHSKGLQFILIMTLDVRESLRLRLWKISLKSNTWDSFMYPLYPKTTFVFLTEVKWSGSQIFFRVEKSHSDTYAFYCPHNFLCIDILKIRESYFIWLFKI